MQARDLLSSKALIIWRIRYTIFTIVLAFFVGMFARFDLETALVLFIIVVILYFYMIFFYYTRKFHSTIYQFFSDSIYIVRGVFFRKDIRVPIKKIQYIQFTVTPLQRWFGICTLILHMMGTKIYLSHVDQQSVKTLNFVFVGEEIKQ